MKIVRRRYQDRIDQPRFDHLLELGEPRDIVLVRDRIQLLLVNVAHRRQLRVLDLIERCAVKAPHVPQPDDAEADGLHECSVRSRAASRERSLLSTNATFTSTT